MYFAFILRSATQDTVFPFNLFFEVNRIPVLDVGGAATALLGGDTLNLDRLAVELDTGNLELVVDLVRSDEDM